MSAESYKECTRVYKLMSSARQERLVLAENNVNKEEENEEHFALDDSEDDDAQLAREKVERFVISKDENNNKAETETVVNDDGYTTSDYDEVFYNDLRDILCKAMLGKSSTHPPLSLPSASEANKSATETTTTTTTTTTTPKSLVKPPKQIIWNQNKEKVFLRIQIKLSGNESLKHEIEYSSTYLSFKCFATGGTAAAAAAAVFGYEFILFAEVDEKLGVNVVSQTKDEYCLEMTKTKAHEWPRLLATLNKPSFIRSEYNNLNASESDDDDYPDPTVDENSQEKDRVGAVGEKRELRPKKGKCQVGAGGDLVPKFLGSKFVLKA